MKTKIILASASPRRKELLEQIGVSFDIYSADIDETPYKAEPPADYVQRMAKSKAYETCAQLQLLKGTCVETKVIVLASDTCAVLDNCIFGKPETKSEFIGMMEQLSDRQHEVMTSVHTLELTSSGINSELAFTVITKVKFKPLSLQEINEYWLTGEPKDKAGGYGIQGKGAVFIESIEGSYSSVVGLPIKETAEVLVKYDVDIWIN